MMTSLGRMALLASAAILAACGGSLDEVGDQRQASSLAANNVGQQSGVRADQAHAASMVAIQGYRSNYTITNLNGILTVQNDIDKSIQSHVGVKTLKFVDRQISFDPTSVEAQVYRLYQAAFNRKPDQEGLGFWIQAARDGVTLDSISQSFISSGEFKKLYGENVSAENFILATYTNVLHRQPDTDGYAWWVNTVKSGSSRSGVLTGFSESTENKNFTSAAVNNGFDFIVPRQGNEPIPVLKSSYENKIAAATALGPQKFLGEAALSNSVAFADFFQDGTYSMVTHSLIYDRDNPATENQFGSVKFHKNVKGEWVDRTAQLLTDVKGCIHPRKAIVADFNGDGKSDVFFACHGFDAAPYAGELPHLLLSQADGTYKNVTLPVKCYCHGASAADASGKGFADILVTDNQANTKVPYLLINNKDGTFTKDLSRLPFNPKTYLAPNTNYGAVVMYAAELIDFDGVGRYDAFLAGTEAPDDESGIPPTIFKNDGKGHYIPYVTLPTDPQYQTTLDIVLVNGVIYLNRVQTKGGAYGFSSIQKIDYKTLSTSRIYNNTNNFATGMTWLNWIIPYQGRIYSQDSAYGVSVTQ